MNAIAPLDLGRDINVVKLAREVAIDHYPIADILARYQITEEVWDQLQEWPRFKELVETERQNWHSATNTNTRIRLKSATLIEEWLEEGYKLLHSTNESFSNKNELIKLLGKFSGLEAQEKVIGDIAGRVTINIKIGETNVGYDGDAQVIEQEVLQESDPDVIDFDWEEEFAPNPTADAFEFFEEVVTSE